MANPFDLLKDAGIWSLYIAAWQPLMHASFMSKINNTLSHTHSYTHSSRRHPLQVQNECVSSLIYLIPAARISCRLMLANTQLILANKIFLTLIASQLQHQKCMEQVCRHSRQGAVLPLPGGQLEHPEGGLAGQDSQGRWQSPLHWRLPPGGGSREGL